FRRSPCFLSRGDARFAAWILPMLLWLGAGAATAHAPAPPRAAARAGDGAHSNAKSKAKTNRKKKRADSTARDGDAPDAVPYGRRDDVLAFAAQLAVDRGLDRAWVEAALAEARYQPGVAKAIMPGPAGSAKNWAAYRARFIEPKRLAAGVQWWRAHARALADAQMRYGVPPALIAGILGVETGYGRMTGGFRALDSLATLAFDFPTGRSDRSGFYRDELRAFLVWCALENRDPASVRGSFAGAVGWPQFMPSSLMKYAVDADHDGHVDLAAGGDDVIYSVANYLAAFGWRPGVPTVFDVSAPADPAARARLVGPDIVPTFTAAQMIDSGVALPDAARAYDGLLALIELQNGRAAPSFVAGTQNFYVVTRYNWSSYYAMAVIELGNALARAMASAPPTRPPAP
ncbi:MAG: lytic murein transglycosylase B, partial [Burkholderiaceae bacterium]